MICKYCNRDVPAGLIQYHHLTPKSKKGKETVIACKSCHEFIHRTWTNKELRDTYNTVESVFSDDRYQKFLKWLMKQPIERSVKTVLRNGRSKNPYR